MTDELHNFAGKPADVTAARPMIYRDDAIATPEKVTVFMPIGRNDSYNQGWLEGARAFCEGVEKNLRDLAPVRFDAALAKQTARAEAAEAREKHAVDVAFTAAGEIANLQARVAELTAKLNAAQVDAAHIRAEALREAAAVCGWDEKSKTAILALIPTPAPSPDAPMPPDGWNVMKLGQVGWHVVQSASGWETSRIFGAECLLRSGGGDEFGPALDATPDGGRVAADAPTPSPDVGELVERVVRAKDTAGAFSKIELTEILAGRTEVAAFCLMLDNHVFPAVIAALAKMKGSAARALAAQEGGDAD